MIDSTYHHIVIRFLKKKSFEFSRTCYLSKVIGLINFLPLSGVGLPQISVFDINISSDVFTITDYYLKKKEEKNEKEILT